jgi:S-adenosylmethionine:tRNA ribosyltransferase-isomerase
VRTDELDFNLPPELIAQTPPAERTDSRLLHYRRDDRSVVHRRFSDLPELLRPGDLLVFNNAQVVPARFMLQKPTGGRVEGLFIDELEPGKWNVLLRNLGRVAEEDRLIFTAAPNVSARMIHKGEAGEYQLAVDCAEPANVFLARIGRMPLPPYIKREKEYDSRDGLDRERYQTVFAARPGAVAAPTAGLHFTQMLLDRLKEHEIETTFVTLQVGLGTFKPVSSDTLETHAMHSETYTLEEPAIEVLNRAKRDDRRIIAVGTTAARVLESQPEGDRFEPKQSSTSIFIYPPYRWKHVNAMITNFHLPRSTLIALVAALIGIDEQRRLYDLAIREKYRFFSYGDAMFIE